MSKWFSEHLERAYQAVHAEMQEQGQVPESPITEALARALAAIEDADCELEKFA